MRVWMGLISLTLIAFAQPASSASLGDEMRAAQANCQGVPWQSFLHALAQCIDPQQRSILLRHYPRDADVVDAYLSKRRAFAAALARKEITSNQFKNGENESANRLQSILSQRTAEREEAEQRARISEGLTNALRSFSRPREPMPDLDLGTSYTRCERTIFNPNGIDCTTTRY